MLILSYTPVFSFYQSLLGSVLAFILNNHGIKNAQQNYKSCYPTNYINVQVTNEVVSSNPGS